MCLCARDEDEHDGVGPREARIFCEGRYQSFGRSALSQGFSVGFCRLYTFTNHSTGFLDRALNKFPTVTCVTVKLGSLLLKLN